MPNYVNPFEYDAAANLPAEMVLNVYVEDYNYTRFIRSHRNVFLLGERGSGKSMTLLYNSFRYQLMKAEQDKKEAPLDFIGVYVPCNTPLTYKREFELLDNDFHAATISEHYVVLSVLFAIADTLREKADLINASKEDELRKDIAVLWDKPLPASNSFLESIKLFAQAESARTQRVINGQDWSSIYDSVVSFSSTVLPLLNTLKEKIPALTDSHFMLMIDDAHDLNHFQRQAVNSWIAYRDHSVYSIKVSSAKVSDHDYTTLSGGAILEGHDFITIDLEQEFQNINSPFAQLAEQIISRRLKRFGIDTGISDFFPPSKEYAEGLKLAAQKARKEAKQKFPKGPNKSINDHVYKYGRAYYFRDRASKANRPPYSGFETIVHLSTGVIRNLLDPCYWMYDRVYDSQQSNVPIKSIPSAIQTEVLIDRSDRLWKRLEDGLDRSIDGCTSAQGKQIRDLFDSLAVLFRDRLLHHKSEPRAIAFTISGLTDDYRDKLLPLLNIAKRAQLLYSRLGPAKDDGKREIYYTPNRMLWPARGLDPVGQHARVSLKASDLWSAANGVRLPVLNEEQENLFDGKL